MEDALLTYQRKRCQSLEELWRIVTDLKSQGKKIVLTSGTFDILHVGHGRYLIFARSLGDYLVVGVDSDAKVRDRKGPSRPVVDQNERVEMLSFLAAVDLLYVKPLGDPRWALIKAVKPDVLVISKRSDYSDEEIVELARYCGSIEVLESQAETSTTARIRSLIISSVAPLLNEFEQVEKLILSMRGKLEEITGGQS